MSILDSLRAPAQSGIFGVVAAPRLSGKCLKEGTLVHTPSGPKRIEEVKPGDKVYGYNKDGSIAPAKVLAVLDQGKKVVTDFLYGNRVIASATEEHRWLTSSKKGVVKEGTTADAFSSDRRIERRFVNHTGGDKIVPYAHAIGALLGNGCCTCGSGTRYDFSSASEEVVASVARQLGGTYKKNSGVNYTWQIHVEGKTNDLYNTWCEGRLAHEKMVDLNEVRTWDRTSQVALLAGLIDTDGSIQQSARNKSFTLSFSSTSKSLADAVDFLILSLYQTQPSVRMDDRDGKNRLCWDVRVNSGFHVKRMLREMDEFIQTPHKKYKPEYDLVNDQRNFENLSVRRGSSYEAQCWDLSIDNETSLYVLTNEGLVTHNSTLAGTLPGKTFFLQAARLETGSSSAQKLAKEMGNDLTIRSFDSAAQLTKVLDALRDADYDNIYVDGLTAITELKYNEDELQKLLKKDNWGAFRAIGKTMFDLILQAKDVTEQTGKNVFFTLALKPKIDSVGNIIEVEPELKGNATIGHIKGLCPVIVVPKETYNEQGQVTRVLLTHSDGVWPARVDTLLDHENPGMLPIRDADGTSHMALANLIKLVKGE